MLELLEFHLYLQKAKYLYIYNNKNRRVEVQTQVYNERLIMGLNSIWQLSITKLLIANIR